MEPDLAAEPVWILDNLEAAVATIIKIPVVDFQVAAAAVAIIKPLAADNYAVAAAAAPAIIKTPVLHTVMKMPDNDINLEAIMAVTWAWVASLALIGMTIMMNRNSIVDNRTHQSTAVIYPVWRFREEQ